MLIVAGTYKVAAEERAAFLENRMASVLHSRSEEGCITYSLSADPLDPAGVLLFEIWESQAALDAHLVAMRAPRVESADEPQFTTYDRQIAIYPIAAEGPHAL